VIFGLRGELCMECDAHLCSRHRRLPMPSHGAPVGDTSPTNGPSFENSRVTSVHRLRSPSRPQSSWQPLAAVIVTIISTSERLPPRNRQGCGSRRLIVGELADDEPTWWPKAKDQPIRRPCEATDEIGKDVSAAAWPPCPCLACVMNSPREIEMSFSSLAMTALPTWPLKDRLCTLP
jgi:hypothetical protein